jgi:hypothetical protein
MRQTLQRLAKMVAGYGMVQWAGPFLSLIFTPIITRILTPEDYGVADYVSTVGAAIGTVALLAGVHNLLSVMASARLDWPRLQDHRPASAAWYPGESGGGWVGFGCPIIAIA